VKNLKKDAPKKAASMDTTGVGWRIPVEIKVGFGAFCKDMGSSIQLNVCGALEAWKDVTPPELRERYRQHVRGTNLMSAEYLNLLRQEFDAALQRTKQRYRELHPDEK
jgi:hypothetical protein